MRLSSLARLALFSLVAACVCGGLHGDEPKDDPSCGDPSAFAEPNLGVGRAYVPDVGDGASLAITVGPQGGCMVTPTICVEAPWLDGEADSECMILSIANEVVDDGRTTLPLPASEGSETLTRFDQAAAGIWCAGSVWNYLDDRSADLEGTTLQMQLEVRSRDRHFASGQMQVVLEPPPDTTTSRASSPSPWG
jgi:hypothetical protein